MTRLGLLALLATGCGVAHADPAPDRFDPASTYAVVVGVLHWKDASFTSFAPEGRKDQALFDLLGVRGVPADHRVLLLDEQATTANAITAIEKLAATAPAGSTFLFYFAGHGAQTDAGDGTVLASFDTDAEDMDATGLRGDEIATALAGFRGGKVIVTADACYTGGLAKVAKAMWARHIPAVSLTSASAANSSTGSWTFTQTLIDALSGRAELDNNGDKHIDLGELDRAVGDAMTHREQQAHGFASYGISKQLVLGDARTSDLDRGAGGYKRGDWVTVDDEVAKVLGARRGKLLLSFYDYATETQRWVSPDELD